MSSPSQDRPPEGGSNERPTTDPGRNARRGAGQKRAPDLRQRLRRATGAELLRLVVDHGHRLGLPEVRQLLANVHVTAEAIDELLANRKLLAVYEVGVAIARHPRTPEHQAMRLIPSLRWRDLLEIAVDSRIRAGSRRAAERYLRERLPRLTPGEKIALARRAPAGLAPLLGTEANLRVLEALLGNPRLTEQAVVAIVGDPRASPRHLDLLARDPRWGPRYAVRAALCRNPRAPFRVLFELLPTSTRADLEAVIDQVEHANLVRERARDLLAARTELAEAHLLDSAAGGEPPEPSSTPNLSEDGNETGITINSDSATLRT